MQPHATKILDEIYDAAMHRGIPLSTDYFFDRNGTRMYLAYNGREAFGFNHLTGKYVYDRIASRYLDQLVRDVSCGL